MNQLLSRKDVIPLLMTEYEGKELADIMCANKKDENGHKCQRYVSKIDGRGKVRGGAWCHVCNTFKISLEKMLQRWFPPQNSTRNSTYWPHIYIKKQ